MKPKRQSDRKLIFDDEGIKAFAIHLKKIRIREEYSQSQLAFESGLSLSQIARIETARINPTLSTVFALARTLNVQLSDLFDFELSPKEK
ncbi:MAG: helix-turn-helix transcriptional regulator [Bacteroidota bacterium]|nr:helix-turn-helix transcriptional regulator [Bacteroidota bacterium]